MPTPSRWQYFTVEELQCKCGCGRADMDEGFMRRIVELRRETGIPFIVTSAYRCPDYNDIISSTGRDGPHTTGRAIDLNLVGNQALTVLHLARGITGIGVKQSGPFSHRFLHLDDLPDAKGRPRPWIWSYS